MITIAVVAALVSIGESGTPSGAFKDQADDLWDQR
jgi:hypothetical protein